MSDVLIAWLDLEQRLLKARRPVEVDFAAVNLANAVVAYRQAALWDGAVSVLSGTASVEANAPYVLWLDRLMREARADAPTLLSSADVAAGLAAEWPDWLPRHALLLPLHGGARLLYARDEPFAETDVALLERVADLAGLARVALRPRRLSLPSPRGWRKWLIAAALAGALMFPVTGSVLAPAESVAAHPVVVRSPLDGVIETIAVAPNEPVIEGRPLFSLDATALTGRLDIARQQLATAEAEHRQVAQAMVFDARAKAQEAILAGKALEKAAEVRLLESQLARIAVKAPRAGIAVFDDPFDWIGKPVAVGERVMLIADETDTEVEAWVSVADVGEIRIGGRLTLFLNTQPLTPVGATVRSLAYEASARPDQSVAHRLRATLDDNEKKPRLGLKGTARIDGDSVPLVWWLFRRPLGAIRQVVGF